MSDSDFIREVDEELRRDQLKTLWDRFGSYVIGAAVLIVVVTAGYRGWQAWQESVSSEAGDRYMSAVGLAEDGQHDDATTALLALTADTSGGYPVLARLRAASETAAAGNGEGAVTAFESIANDSSVDQTFRDLALIRASFISLDIKPYDDIAKKIEPLAAAGQTWRHSAREIMGLASWKAEKYADAEKWFSMIVDDTEATQALKTRAQMVLTVVRSELPAPAASEDDKKAGDGGATN